MQPTDLQRRLNEERGRIRQQLAGGACGLEVSYALCDLVDDALSTLRQSKLEQLSPADRNSVENGLAYIALAGYGRRDIAPYSDVDLVLLKADDAPPVVEAFAKQAVRDIWDAGLKLGQTLATTAEFLKLARAEAITTTSVMEARHLFGPKELTDNLLKRFRTAVRRGGVTRWCRKILAAAHEEQAKYGSTVHLLEPDLKRSKGGLRDIHLLRWLGILLYETPNALDLEKEKAIGAGDAEQIRLSHDFLLRVRANLHFHAGNGNDSLSRSEQMRLAREWGFTGTESLLPVEQFMREYFRHTKAVADIVDRFIEGVRPLGMVEGVGQMVLSRRLARGIWLTSRKIIANDDAIKRHCSNLAATLELIHLAASHEADLDRPIVEAFRETYGNNGELPAGQEATPKIDGQFLSMLSKPGRLHKLLRIMHQAGVLRQILPEFEHARCLLQFNAYHKYTVDEHTFVMLRHAEELIWSSDLLGQEYRRIQRKDLLHLAILLHDLGKGYEEDHSEVGRRIAEEVADRFQLPEDDRETLVFLVHQHLYLSRAAFHRDTSDPGLWVQVSRTVGSAGLLRMLYVLTAVDIMAVGPGTFNQWKSDVLRDLYLNTISLFGEAEVAEEKLSGLEQFRRRLEQANADHEQVAKFVDALPPQYLSDTSLEEAAEHLARWERRKPCDVDTWASFNEATKTTTYTVMTDERVTDGIFHKICGGLAAHHLKVLSARIHTLADGTVIDQFTVKDPHSPGTPPDDKVERVAKTVRRILIGELAVSDALWSSRSSLFVPQRTRYVRDEPRVVVDNRCSAKYTVIDVFAGDNRGLLFTLAKAINRLGLSVWYAKIATYADEGVDVFYVLEADGKKVHREDRVQFIEKYLLHDIQTLLKDPRSMGF